MLARWALLLASAAVASAGLLLVQAPAPFLLGGLLAGLLVALVAEGPEVPAPAGTAGQALIGVSVGGLVTGELLTMLVREGGVVVFAVTTTLVASLAWGLVLRLQPGVSAVTAAFASIAGGASGVVATARDAGADEPVVATIQYLRVLLILFTMPVVARLFDPDATGAFAGAADEPGSPGGYLFSVCAVALGLLLARSLAFPGAAVLWPMGVAVGLAASGWFGATDVPGPLLAGGYVVIGGQVGLKFTRSTLRVIARLLPLALVQVVGTIVTCAVIGWAVAELAGIGLLDAYLATTPGGLYAVVAVAISTDADSGLVFSLQVLRLFGSLLLVPVLARVLRPHDRVDEQKDPDGNG